MIALVLAAAFLWVTPSPDYLYVPNRATPVGDRVKVQGQLPDDGKGAIYYVDVTIRKASWAERLLAPLRPDGASLVPAAEVAPPGSSFEKRRQQGRQEMARSEEVAAAVALKAAGYKVSAKPKGALIEAVATDVPAADQLDSGDVVVRALGKPVRTPGDLRRAFVGVVPGRTVVLGLERGGKLRVVAVKTVASPEDPQRAIVGVRVSQAADIRLPVKVDINLGNVGGPSAGLPFALAITQELGHDVDGGRKVVATGEMELDGTVAPIGGVKQKVFGARRAGADIFLVPAGENATEARRYAGNLRIVPVSSFQQALSALQTLPSN